MTNATATMDIRMIMMPMYPPAFIESRNVRCLSPGLVDLPVVDVAVGDASLASAPTVGFLSSWASSAETNAGCVRNWPIQQTAASISDRRSKNLHRHVPYEHT